MIEEKRRSTDRQRGGHFFVETRTGPYYLKVGYLAGLGHSSIRIAEELGDGIHPSYIRTLIRRAGFRPADVHCVVPITNHGRAMLTWRAEKRGMSLEDYLGAIARAIAEEDLYEAIVGK